MSEEIVDYGEITVPTRWEEMTLKQYADLSRYYSDKDRKFNVKEVLHILTGLSEDDINNMPVEFTETMLTHLTFIEKEPEIGEPRNYIDIEGTRYQINVQEKLKTGEFVSVSSMMKDDPYNTPLFLAIMCRKEGEPYDSKYENEIVQDRLRMFEQVPMTDALPIINFFLHLWIVSMLPTQLSSTLREEIDHIASSIGISRRNGDLSAPSYLRLKRDLGKLRRQINSI